MRTAASITVRFAACGRRIRRRSCRIVTALATAITATAIRRVVLTRRAVIADYYDISIAIPTNALPTAMPLTAARAAVIVGIITAITVCISTKERIKQIAHSISSPSCVFEKTLIL